MKSDFYNELQISNSSIVDKILRLMRENLHPVSEIKDHSEIVPTNPILYRWWVPYDSEVMSVLWEKSKEYADLFNVLNNIEIRLIAKKPYCALYFGKSSNGRTRIFSQHIYGDVETSTLRHTIYSLCIGDKYDSGKETEVKDILNKSYFEWLSCDACEVELIVPLEVLCIALGNYPLNIDGNCAINKETNKNEDWLEHLKALRIISKKPKK